MKINLIKYPNDEDWLRVRNAALATQRKSSNETPSSNLRLKFLMSEHSQIRLLEYEWEFEDIEYWISVHFVRHHEGITHFVSSQRNDIQKIYDRRLAPQNSLVNHRCVANAQAILNISKARLCMNASIETRWSWIQFLDSIEHISPELAHLCVRPCVYRGSVCPEVFKSCGYNKTERFQKELGQYQNYFKEYEKKKNE